MKIEVKNVKNAFKYISIALGILIMIILFYFTVLEFTNKELNLLPVVLNETSNSEFCQDSEFHKFTNLAAKSIMAFLFGCLLSEKKFIKFGII